MFPVLPGFPLANEAVILSSGGITVESVSTQYLSVAGVTSATIVWHSDRAGSYSVRVNPSSCSTGGAVQSGSIDAGSSITSTVQVADLTAGTNNVWLCVVPQKDSIAFALMTITRDDAAPVFSGVLSAALASATQVNLSWTTALDGASAQNNIIYDVYQAGTSGGQSFAAPTYSTAPGATSYSVTGLTGGASYFFVVRARDQAGNRDANVVERNANAFFVDKLTGNNGNPGTSTLPKLTIQNAISASNTEGLGRPVLVSKATYNEVLTIQPNVSIFGGYDASANWTRNIAGNVTSVISTTADTAAITVNNATISNTTKIDGFTITGATAVGAGQSAIAVMLGSPSISHNAINGGVNTNNNPFSSVGVRVSGGNPTIQNNTINGGTSSGAGYTAGVHVSGGTATISNNTIDGGVANSNGCGATDSIGIRSEVTITVTSNRISGGTSNGGGCGGNTNSFGVKLNGGSAVVQNNTISAGTVTSPTAATRYTSGIECSSCTALIRNNTIAGGTGAASAPSYGISLESSASPTIINNIIFNPGSLATIQYGVAELVASGDPAAFENNLIFGFATAIYRNENAVSINDTGADCILDGAPNNELNAVGGTVNGNRTLCGGQTMAQVMVAPTGTDFHLVAGSAAIDFGKALAGLVDTDKDARARPQGGVWDIGAYEY